MSAIIGSNVDVAASFLNDGKLVAIPTETVYGLAANCLNERAVAEIFQVKQRPYFDPLIVHVSSINEFTKWAVEIPDAVYQLCEHFCPGPITFVLKKNVNIPDIVTSGLETVGIRVPNHPMTLALLNHLDFPLCAPSANPFGYVSPVSALHVAEQLGEKIPYILDGGVCRIGIESTIVGFEDGSIVIYRLGGAAVEEIEKALGKRVELKITKSSNPIAPGMLHHHYAPRKRVVIGSPYLLTEKYSHLKRAYLLFKNHFQDTNDTQVVVAPDGNLLTAAANLFSALRELDKCDADIIIAEIFPEQGIGRAINDRLERAQGIIE